MNTALVDHLACPRCGPAFGLVLLAREVRERRVRRGELGCPNCRDAFPVEEGFADLRPPPRRPLRMREVASGSERTATSDSAADRAGDHALRVAAALGGAAAGPGVIVVSEGVGADATALGRLVPDVEVVVLGRSGGAGAAVGDFDARVAASVSLVAIGAAMPFRDGFARGVALAGQEWERLWREAVRVVGPGACVVATDAPPDARAALEGEGLTTVLVAEGWLAAQRPFVRPPPRRATLRLS